MGKPYRGPWRGSGAAAGGQRAASWAPACPQPQASHFVSPGLSSTLRVPSPYLHRPLCTPCQRTPFVLPVRGFGGPQTAAPSSQPPRHVPLLGAPEGPSPARCPHPTSPNAHPRGGGTPRQASSIPTPCPPPAPQNRCPHPLPSPGRSFGHPPAVPGTLGGRLSSTGTRARGAHSSTSTLRTLHTFFTSAPSAAIPRPAPRAPLRRFIPARRGGRRRRRRGGG